MASVKRSSPDGNDASRSLKKFKRSDVPLEELSEGGLLSEDDVVYYQKEAIYRMMILMRHRYQRAKKDLDNMNAKYSTLSSYYSVINNWWSQVIDNFKNFDIISKEKDELHNNHLLIEVLPSSDSPIGKEDLASALKAKRNKLIKLLQPILSQPVQNREEKITSLEESLTSINSFKLKLEDENNLLKRKIEALNKELDKYIKLIEIKKSKSLDRISDNLRDREELREEEEHDEKENGIVKSNPEEDKPSASESNSTDSKEFNALKSKLEDMQIEVTSLKAKSETLETQLSEKSAKLAIFEKQATELKVKMGSLTADDLVNCTEYQAVLTQNSNLSSQLNQIKFDSSKIESRLHELESKQTVNKQKLEEELRLQMTSNKTYTAKLESDITRIRADRDKLRSEASILKAEKGKTELSETLKKENDALEKRIKALTSKEPDTITGDIHQDSTVLLKKNQVLLTELKQMEEAFNSMRQVAGTRLNKYEQSDAYLNKLSVEKAKADEKYFQAMRTKDALTSENKILNGNVAKQTELIEVLRTNEKKLMKKLDVENTLYSKLKDLESIYNNDLTIQTNHGKEIEIRLKTTEKTNSKLQTDLITKQNDLSEKNKKIDSLISHNETMNSKIKELESLVEKYRSNTRTAEDEEINQALLTMTKCQLCNKNFKNVALKTCGHCFCDECIHNRLKSRMRKCPSCNMQFSRNDLLSIHL